MNEGAACCVVPKRQDDVGIDHTRKLVALLWETPDVILEGFAWLLLAALQIPGVVRMHVCALEVIGEDLSEDLLAIDDVSWQMI
jgi:hypothetical protein